MTSRLLSRTLLSLALVVALSACSDDGGGVPASDAPGEVTGVLTDIESASIGDVQGFTLKDGNKTYEILIDDEVEYGFDLGHLQEHLSGSLPVRVELEERDGAIYAVTIDDA